MNKAQTLMFILVLLAVVNTVVLGDRLTSLNHICLEPKDQTCHKEKCCVIWCNGNMEACRYPNEDSKSYVIFNFK